MHLLNKIPAFVLLLALLVFPACKKEPNVNGGDDSKPNATEQSVMAIGIDGVLDDWTAEPLAIDAKGDASGTFDLLSVWAQAANGYLYVSFELNNGTEFNLQNGVETDSSLFKLVIHQGDNSREIDFRNRQFVDQSKPEQVIPWSEVGFTCLPTYASNRYELQVKLETEDNDLKIEFSGSDSLDEPLAVPTYSNPKATAESNIERVAESDFRIGNLHTLNNGLADPQRGPTIHRMMAGVGADIYTLQEEWKPKEFYTALKPLAAAIGVKRLNAKWSSGCAIITKLPIEKLPTKLDRAIAGLIKLESGKHLVVISVHFKSRGHVDSREDGLRAQQAEQLVGEIKRMRAGEFGEKAKKASVVVIGDYNLVGSRKPVDILNKAGLQDQLFTNPVTRTAYTWRDDVTTFAPSRLDWFCHSGLEPLQTIVLDTGTLDDTTLEQNNLQKSDSTATDHLMLIGDFNIKGS